MSETHQDGKNQTVKLTESSLLDTVVNGSVKLGMDFQAYLDVPAIDNTQIKTFRQSIPRYHSQYVTRSMPIEESEAMALGTSFHDRVLYADKFEAMYRVEPTVNKRTKAGKEELAEFYEQCKRDGVASISQADWDTVDKMGAAVLANQWFYDMMQIGQNEGLFTEVSLFWSDHRTSLDLKGRVDILIPSRGVAIDLKTWSGENFHPDEYAKHVFRYSYHTQAAMYVNGLAVTLDEDYSFYHVAVSKQEPHEVGIYALYDVRMPAATEALLRLGELENRNALAEISHRMVEDYWEGRCAEPTFLNVPHWEERKLYQS